MRYLFLVTLFLVAFPALSDTAPAAPVPFEQAIFEEALAEGRPVLVDVWASWCPTCRRQGRVLSTLLAEERYTGVLWLKVDFDDQKEVVRAFQAPRQSVLIMYAAGAERARSVADTNAQRIRALVDTGLE